MDLKAAHAAFEAAVLKAGNLPELEYEAAVRSATSQLLVATHPDLVKSGHLDHVRRDMENMLLEASRTTDSRGRKRSRNQVMQPSRQLLLTLSGFASAALRTGSPTRPKMTKDAAQRKVSQWSRGHVTPAQIAHWTPKFGSVSTSGRDISEHQSLADGARKLFSLDMSEVMIKRRVKKAVDEYSKIIL